MDSFNKIMNLDLNNLEDKDFTYSLEHFFTLTNSEEEKEFLNKYKIAISKYLEVLLTKVDIYPVSTSYNKDIYKIDRLLYMTYSFYGFDVLKEMNFKKGVEKVDDKVYHNSIKRYYNRVRTELINDIELLNNIELYNKRKKLINTYCNIDENLLKEAYNVYFTLDNFFDKDNCIKRRNKFVKDNKLNFDILEEYAYTYGTLFLKYSLKELNKMMRSIKTTLTRSAVIDVFRLERVVFDIEQCNDLSKTKALVLDNHISLEAVNYLFDRFSYNEKYHNKDLIIAKVKKALKSLEEEDKYIHYSIVLSKIEKTDDYNEIVRLVYNNEKLLISNIVDKFIYTYRINLPKNEKEKLKESLTEKINNAKKIIKEKNNKVKASRIKSKQMTLFSEINFKLFLNDEITSISSFCELTDISRDKFNEGLEYLKVIDNTLYVKIKAKIDNLKGKRFAVIASKTDVIANNIINGIKEDDNSIREFQILDYFLMTKLSFNDFINIYLSNSNINKDKLQKIKIFFKKNKLENKIDIKTELNGKTIFMINNAPYEVTEEEKKEVISFLTKKQIPLYTKVYKQALKRHINGNLILGDDKKLMKKG